MTNNHVGMSVCPLCGEAKYIALATRYRTNAKGEFESVTNIPNKFVDSPDLCDNCVKKFTENNLHVIFEADITTKIRNGYTKHPKLAGNYIILPFDLVDKSCPFYDYIKKKRFVLATPEEFARIKKIVKEKQECQTMN